MQVFDIPYFNTDIALISLLKHELTEVEFCWANHVSVIQSWWQIIELDPRLKPQSAEALDTVFSGA